MDKTFKYEFAVLLLLGFLLLLGVVWSGFYARREQFDGQTRSELRELKHQLEIYFNEQGYYPPQWPTGEYEYVVTKHDGQRAQGWYVSGQLKNKHQSATGFDQEYHVAWRVTKAGYYQICGGTDSCAAEN